MTYEAGRCIELKRPVGSFKFAYIDKVETHDPDPFNEYGGKYPPYTVYIGHYPDYTPVELTDDSIKGYRKHKVQEA